MRKIILLCSMLAFGWMGHAQTTVIDPGGPVINTCQNGQANFDVDYYTTNNNFYNDVGHKVEIYKGATLMNPGGPFVKKLYSPTDVSAIGWLGANIPASYGSGTYTIKVIAAAFSGPVIIYSESDVSNPVTINFTQQMAVSFKINGLSGQYVTPCFTEPITLTNFSASCRTSSNTFLSIMETNGAWGPIIGTEKMTWTSLSDPSGLDLKMWSMFMGLPLQEGHYYTMKVAIGSPFTAYSISMYIKPTAPGLHVNGTPVTGASYPGDLKTVCSSLLNTAFNMYSTTCEGRYFVEVSECQYNLVKTGTHEWNFWFDALPGVENTEIINMANLTAVLSVPTSPGSTTNSLGGHVICNPYSASGFQMNGGNLPGTLGQRFWRVTIATDETGWKSITALVRVNDGCMVVEDIETRTEDMEANMEAKGAMVMGRDGHVINLATASAEELLTYLKPVENAVTPKFILAIDKEQSGISVEHTIYPNPASENFSLDINLLKDDKVEIELVDLNGQVVKNILPANNLTTGKYTYASNLSGLSKGVYMVRIKTGSQIITDKLVIQ